MEEERRDARGVPEEATEEAAEEAAAERFRVDAATRSKLLKRQVRRSEVFPF